MKLAPANNVLLAYIAGVLATIAMHYAKEIGYEVPSDISNALPAGIAIGLAHLYDTITERKDNSRSDS